VPLGGRCLPMKTKAIIHIGGGYLQLPCIRWAKELGLTVVLTDRTTDPSCRQLVKDFRIIDGTDVTGLLKLSREVNENYELVGVYASCDFGLKSAAAIAEAIGLPGCSPVAVERALEKNVSKEIWLRESIPTPDGMVVKDMGGLSSAEKELDLPVIVKPANSSGSCGVRSVWDSRDFKRAYTNAQQFSDSVVVEKLTTGQHIDVNGLFIEGEFIGCGMIDRFFSEPPYHYSIWGCQPCSVTKEQQGAIYYVVERAARALGIETGPVKADIVWTDKGPVILELAPRFHGDIITANITPLATSGSPVKAWMAYLCGKSDPIKYIKPGNEKFAGWMALFADSHGKLLSVDGLDEVKQKSGIHDFFISFKPGSIIKDSKDNRSMCGFVWAAGANRDEVFGKLSVASKTIRFNTA